jgi:hypothetical protein
MDPTHVGLRVCGYLYQHVGLPYLVENDMGYWQRDDFEFGKGQVVGGDDVAGMSDVGDGGDRRIRGLAAS